MTEKLLDNGMEKLEWQEAEKKFVKLMEKNKDVLLVEHISLFAQNSEWDVSVYWKNGEKWYVDVTTGIRKKFNKPKNKGRFFLAFTKTGNEFDLFEITHTEIKLGGKEE